MKTKYCLYYFSSSNGEREFVVVSDQPKEQVLEEFEGEASFVESHDLCGDCTSLPCDRVLTKE